MNPSLIATSYTFKIQMTMANDTTNAFLVEFLNSSEYARYNANISLTDLIPIKVFDKTNDTTNDTIFADILSLVANQSYYLLVSCTNATTSLFVDYFVSIIASNYYLGIQFLGYGWYLIIAVLLYYAEGWKRYLYWGVGINAGAFLIGMALFPSNYSLMTIFGSFFQPEMYGDYNYLYMSWVRALWSGNSPYSAAMPNYIYTPLFVLLMGLFNVLPFPAWKCALPLFFFNMLTGYLVFRIVRDVTKNEKYASLAMLFYYLNPFVLIYGSMMWFNPPVFVFFTLLAFYYAYQRKYGTALFVLGIATMFKQFAALFFPLLILFLLKDLPNEKWGVKIKTALKACCMYLIPVVLISLPFLILDASTYLERTVSSHVFYDLTYFTTFQSALNMPVQFNSFLFGLAMPSSIILIFGYFLTDNLLLIGWLILILAWFFFDRSYFQTISSQPLASHQISASDLDLHHKQLFIEVMFWAMLIVFGFQLFYNRGTYKYYLILLAPFVGLLFLLTKPQLSADHPHDFKTLRPYPSSFTAVMVLSWVIFFFNRFLYFGFLIIWVGYYFYVKRSAIKIKPTPFTRDGIKNGRLATPCSVFTKLFRFFPVCNTSAISNLCSRGD